VQGGVAELLNNQEIIVQFKLDQPKKGLEILKQQANYANCEMSIEDGELLIHTTMESIANINKIFCDNNLAVSAIETKRKLEDYFLRLINS